MPTGDQDLLVPMWIFTAQPVLGSLRKHAFRALGAALPTARCHELLAQQRKLVSTIHFSASMAPATTLSIRGTYPGRKELVSRPEHIPPPATTTLQALFRGSASTDSSSRLSIGVSRGNRWRTGCREVKVREGCSGTVGGVNSACARSCWSSY